MESESRRHAMHLAWRGMYRNVTWHRIRLRLLARSDAIQPGIARLLPPSNFSRVFLPFRASGGVSSHPTGGQIVSRRPEILPRLHSRIMRREPSTRRVPARDPRPRRWLLVRRDRNATIEDRDVPCLSSNYIVYRRTKRTYRAEDSDSQSSCSGLKNRRGYCNFKSNFLSICSGGYSIRCIVKIEISGSKISYLF